MESVTNWFGMSNVEYTGDLEEEYFNEGEDQNNYGEEGEDERVYRSDGKEWFEIDRFNNEKDAWEWYEEFKKDEELVSGNKQRTCSYFLCKYKSKGCKYQQRFRYCQESSVVYQEESLVHSNHPLLTYVPEKGLSESQKGLVVDLFEEGVTQPLQILKRLTRMFDRGNTSIPVPLKTKLETFLRGYKKKKFGGSDVTIEMLESQVERFLEEPNDIDESFILDYELNMVKGKVMFRMTMSSRRMLDMCPRHGMVNADTTHNVTWMGIPCYVLGMSDMDRVFHPMVVGIGTNETGADFEFFFRSWKKYCPGLIPRYLMADHAQSIRNGAEAVWPDIKRCMCYAHCFIVSMISTIITSVV